MLKIESDSAGQTKVVVHKRDEAGLLSVWTQCVWLASKLEFDEQYSEAGMLAGEAADALEKLLKAIGILKPPSPEAQARVDKLTGKAGAA